MDNTIACTLCGQRFDPAKNPACANCPLHTGCSTACCPNCGTTNINPAGSRLATFLTRLFERNQPAPSSIFERRSGKQPAHEHPTGK